MNQHAPVVDVDQYADQQLLKQEELEHRAVTSGRDRFWTRVDTATEKGRGSTAGAATTLLVKSTEALTIAIEEWLENLKGQRGVKPVAYRWVPYVGADVAAFITSRVVLDSIHEKTRLKMLANEISDRVLMEIRAERLKTEAPGLFHYRVNTFKGTAHYRHMRNSMLATMKYAEVDLEDLDIPKQHRLLMGLQLLNLFVEATGLVETVVERMGKKRTDRYLIATQETSDAVADRNSLMADYWPVLGPMVAPPLEWSPEERGGYRGDLRGKLTLLRSWSDEQSGAVAQANIPLVYEALNALQNTAWKINHDVLAVVEEAMRRQADVRLARDAFLKVPRLHKIEPPRKPASIDTDEDARRAWKKEATVQRTKEMYRRSHAETFLKTMSVVRHLKEEDAIFFPHNMDFRGRVYPVSDYLHPQGNDLSRGIITFAEGKPLGETGGRALALHGFNCMEPEGLKFASLDEREAWVERNTEKIEASALDPWDNLWWAEAEKPLQFLAFCFEWVGYKAEGEAFVSRIPCGMDGSCNGLQHFAALWRDPVGGKAVNLLPGDRPEDIYSRMADAVLDKLEDVLTDEDEQRAFIAQVWIDSRLVNRKMCKRPTMTFGYGSKRYGFTRQILEYLEGLDNYTEILSSFTVEVEEDEKCLINRAAALMSELIWWSLQDVVVSAFKGMEWMQECVRIIGKENKPIRWTVPVTGLPVRQEYWEMKKHKVRTVLSGQIVKPTWYSTTAKINATRQANGIAPNFIHSLDAAALMLTVSMARREGIDNFVAIHDSFATHAADYDVLASCTRQAFVRLHSEKIIGSLYEQIQAQTEQELPAPPVIGDLDLGMVLASDYFFA